MSNDEIVLLSISLIQESESAIQEALRLAEEDNLLLVLYLILETHNISTLVDNLADQGYVGDITGKNIADSLECDYDERAQTIVKKVKDFAKERSVEFQYMVLRGDFTQELEKALQRWTVAHLVLVEPRCTLWEKMFGKKAKCDLKFPIDSTCHIHWIKEANHV